MVNVITKGSSEESVVMRQNHITTILLEHLQKYYGVNSLQASEEKEIQKNLEAQKSYLNGTSL